MRTLPLDGDGAPVAKPLLRRQECLTVGPRSLEVERQASAEVRALQERPDLRRDAHHLRWTRGNSLVHRGKAQHSQSGAKFSNSGTQVGQGSALEQWAELQLRRAELDIGR